MFFCNICTPMSFCCLCCIDHFFPPVCGVLDPTNKTNIMPRPIASTSRHTTSLLPSISQTTSYAASPVPYESATTPLPVTGQKQQHINKQTTYDTCTELNVTPQHATFHGMSVGQKKTICITV